MPVNYDCPIQGDLSRFLPRYYWIRYVLRSRDLCVKLTFRFNVRLLPLSLVLINNLINPIQIKRTNRRVERTMCLRTDLYCLYGQC